MYAFLEKKRHPLSELQKNENDSGNRWLRRPRSPPLPTCSATELYTLNGTTAAVSNAVSKTTASHYAAVPCQPSNAQTATTVSLSLCRSHSLRTSAPMPATAPHRPSKPPISSTAGGCPPYSSHRVPAKQLFSHATASLISPLS